MCGCGYSIPLQRECYRLCENQLQTTKVISSKPLRNFEIAFTSGLQFSSQPSLSIFERNNYPLINYIFYE